MPAGKNRIYSPYLFNSLDLQCVQWRTRPTMCPVEKEKPDWKKIAPRAVQERDPDKLLAIIEELNAVLEAGANERRARLYPRAQNWKAPPIRGRRAQHPPYLMG